MTAAVQDQLHALATTLLERRGALVDWPAADRAGTAILPPDVADAVGMDREVVSLACEPNESGLSANLAGDFLEWSGRLLAAVPSVGAFRVRDLYLKRKALDEGIGRAFTWLNAKVKFREGRETTVEYHTWWFHAALSSEDRWETCFGASLNAASGVEVEIPDPLGLWELQPQRGSCAETPTSYPTGGRHGPTAFAAFVRRLSRSDGRSAPARPQAAPRLLPCPAARVREEEVARACPARPRENCSHAAAPSTWNCGASWRSWTSVTRLQPSCVP